MKSSSDEDLKRCAMALMSLGAILLILAVMYAVVAEAAGVVYSGASKAVSCTDATERTDGTSLSASEIDRVEIYVGATDGGALHESTMIMSGGCKPMALDLTRLSEGQKYQYGVTYDTAGRVSAHSASLPFIYQLSLPNPPVMVE
jgi:hypothetical protein